MTDETEALLQAFAQTDLSGKELNPAEKLKASIRNIQAELDSDFPALSDDMAKIRKCILAAPELAHELTEEEQRSIFAGMQYLQGIALVPEKAKKEKVAKVIGEETAPKVSKAKAKSAEPEAMAVPPPPVVAPAAKSAAQAKLEALLKKRTSK